MVIKMGYLMLAIAVLAGAVKGYCGKKTSRYVTGTADAALANFMRMLLCVVIGFVTVLASGSLDRLALPLPIAAITVLSGAGTAFFVVTWLMAIRKGAFTMIDVVLMLGTIIPIIGSFLLFGEPIKPNQIIGFCVLMAAVAIMCSYNNSLKGKMSPMALVLVLLCGISNGLADFSQKMFVRYSDGIPVSVFNFYTYIVAGIILLVCFFCSKDRKSGEGKTGAYIKHTFGYIAVMSVCLFANSYFKTLAAAHLDAAQIYPLSQGSALILSSLMAAIFFGEKITWRAVVGMVLAFGGMLVINLL